MKLKTEEEIKVAADKASEDWHPYLKDIDPDKYFVITEAFYEGANWMQQDLLSQASEGFEEWIEDKDHFFRMKHQDDPGIYEGDMKLSWQAAKLSSAKEIERLRKEVKDREEEMIRLNHLLGKTANDHLIEAHEARKLQKENEELKRYKEQWQDIAGKANLKNLVATVEKLEKENEELKQELLLSKPLYSQRKLEERIKEAEEIIVSWNEYLKRENELASKIGTVADDYIAKWSLPENTDSSKGEVK